MKSVLHVITGLENGGAEAVLYRLVINDSQTKHSVVSLRDMGKYGSLLQAHNIPVYCLDMAKGGMTFGAMRKLWKIIRKERPDILQAWMYHANLIAGIIGKLAGVKNIYWCIHNSTLLRKATPLNTLVVNKVSAFLSYVLPERIISCAQNAIDVNVSTGYSRAKFCLIPNGYDVSEFKPDPAVGKQLREQWSIPENTFLIGNIGRFDPQKDFENLVTACGILSKEKVNYRLLLVGPGIDNNNEELCSWIRNEGIEGYTILIGPQDNIPAIMNSLDILVLSSRGEAFPNVLCEAMSCGTPCVSTTVGDAALIVGNTGWLVPPRNSAQLAKGIMEAMEEWQNKERWKSVQNNARERIVISFSIGKMITGYHRVWGFQTNEY